MGFPRFPVNAAMQTDSKIGRVYGDGHDSCPKAKSERRFLMPVVTLCGMHLGSLFVPVASYT
jgi:hypothetical protein